MDKIAAYRQAIREIITYYAKEEEHSYSEYESQAIMDDERGHYLVTSVGWDEHKRIRGILMQIDLRGTKVWIQQNGTDTDIAEELVEKGVAREDIVLGFISPFRRKYTAYAVQ